MALLGNNLLERSTGHILDVSVNGNSFCVQCSVMASAALTRDGVLHYFPGQVKFYSLSFHVIDIKHLFQRNKLLYYLEGCRCEGQNFEQRNVERSKFRNFKIANIKIMKNELFDSFIIEFIFLYLKNYFTKNTQ